MKVINGIKEMFKWIVSVILVIVAIIASTPVIFYESFKGIKPLSSDDLLSTKMEYFFVDLAERIARPY